MLGVLDSSLPAVNLAALADPEIEELLLECVADYVKAARYCGFRTIPYTHSGRSVHRFRGFRTPLVGGAASAGVS